MAKPSKAASSQLRIIGGQWRGRKLSFPIITGLRPTPDRIRETVFNWLQPFLGHAHCVDLFAGSGALGLEAASRGAQQVDMIELNTLACTAIRSHLQTLAAQNCSINNSTAQHYISRCQTQYDVVFIDPPYAYMLWTEVAFLLETNKLLAENAIIYLECSAKQPLPELPKNWLLLKDKKAGEVRYCLFQCNTES